MVEQGPFKPEVEGSTPSQPTVGPWCKGSTGGFGPPCLGSNPSGPVFH